MGAVGTKVRADLRRRKLQSIIIAFVILLSSGAATLALSLLVESDAPYDHAFAQANGAHLTLTFAASNVSGAQLKRTVTAHGVTETAGPWPEAHTTISSSSPDGSGRTLGWSGPIVGRDRPDTRVDHLTIESGRWVRAPGEIVLSQQLADQMGTGAGSDVTVGDPSNGRSLTVVGIASSISPFTDAWVVPAQIPALVAPGTPLSEQMLWWTRATTST
jgi:putative ABC transport system permease protein